MGREFLAQVEDVDEHCAQTRLARSVVSDCYAEGKGTLSFRGVGGHGWLFSMVGAVCLWIREWPTCGGGAAKDAMIPLTAVPWLLLFLIRVVVFVVRFLSLISVYGPVSGAGFDQEHQQVFNCMSNLLGPLPFVLFGSWAEALDTT